MRRFGRVRWLILIQAAAASLIAGHALDYLIVVPDNGHRRALLDLTGHGYLSTGGTIAVILAIAAVVASIGSGIVGRRKNDAAASWPATAFRLAAIQSSSFLAMEAAERVAAGASLSTLTGRLIVVGVVVQAVVAALTAAALIVLERTGAAVSTLLARRFVRPRPPLVLGPAPTHVTLRDRIAESSLRCRAPPHLLSFA